MIYGIETLEFDDFDEQSKCMESYDQDYLQLSCGKFRGRFSTISLGPEATIYLERNNQAIDEFSTVPDDRYTLFFLMDGSADIHQNGFLFSCNDLLFCGPSSEFHSVGIPQVGNKGQETPGPLLAAINISKEHLDRQVFADIDCDLGIMPGYKFKFYKDFGPSIRTVRALVRSAFMELTFSTALSTRILDGIRSDILEWVYYALSEISGKSNITDTFTYRRRRSIVMSVRDIFDGHHDDSVSIGRVSHEIGINRRSLERCFREQVGVSPAAYLRSVRLNRIRKELLSASNAEHSIGDIASKYGFWHLGRLAQYYRIQFGELPSETRNANYHLLA